MKMFIIKNLKLVKIIVFVISQRAFIKDGHFRNDFHLKVLTYKHTYIHIRIWYFNSITYWFPMFCCICCNSFIFFYINEYKNVSVNIYMYECECVKNICLAHKIDFSIAIKKIVKQNLSHNTQHTIQIWWWPFVATYVHTYECTFLSVCLSLYLSQVGCNNNNSQSNRTDAINVAITLLPKIAELNRHAYIFKYAWQLTTTTSDCDDCIEHFTYDKDQYNNIHIANGTSACFFLSAGVLFKAKPSHSKVPQRTNLLYSNNNKLIFVPTFYW